MRRALFTSLTTKLVKIYFSNVQNKDYEYKRTVFNSFKDMGGVYIKFLQVLCITQKFMDGWGSPKEFEVFNQVKTEPININNYKLDKNRFLSIDDKPFACGSFAQLYKGKLKTGEDIAIKILRPSISFTLRNDLKELRKIVRLMSYIMPNDMLDYRAAFEEFASNCLLETDYEREVSNMKYFGGLYKDSNYIVIPKVYEELCSKNVIVQEFITGPTLADIISTVSENETIESKVFDLIGSDIWIQIMFIGGEALRTALVADYVFGDPHPGNIILLPQNKIAFIDFGIIANKPTSQEAFYLWTKSYYDILKGGSDYSKLLQTSCLCFCPDLVNALNKCSQEANVIELLGDALSKKINSLSNVSAQKLVKDGHIFKLFTEHLDSKNALKIKLDMRNFKLIKAMQAFVCSIATIDKHFGDNKFSRIMLGAMAYALNDCEKKGVPSDLITKTKYSLNESYELLLDMISSLASGDEYLFKALSERTFL